MTDNNNNNQMLFLAKLTIGCHQAKLLSMSLHMIVENI